MSDPTRADRGLFSPAVVGFLVASIVAIFALSVLLATMSHQDAPIGTTATSASAIGHKGFYALLQRLDLPVGQSRIKDTLSARRGGLLVIDEPPPESLSPGETSALFKAPDALLILPKWSGGPDLFHEGWIGDVAMLKAEVPQQVLRVVDRQAQIVRGPAPTVFPLNDIGTAPKLPNDTQLIVSSTLTPIVAVGDRMLIAEYAREGRRIWILADPDPTENHAITLAENARFAFAMIKKLKRGRGPIVFDETVHGSVAPERNPIQLLFQFPFVIVTTQIIAAFGLLLLATTARFGRAEEPPPPFALGKARLIDNIAALMDRAGHQAHILRRYISLKLAEMGRVLHAPPGLDERALAIWLDRIGAQRGVGLKASAIVAEDLERGGRRSTSLQQLFAEARAMHRWNEEMLDGSRRRQDNG